MFKLRGKKCERCPSTCDLELHHLTYERFGREQPSDLQILCPVCHDRADQERMEASETVFQDDCETTRYARETYLEKVYGGFRASWMDEEFDAWLEKKCEDQHWS
jgi:hypothetical protein